MTDNAVWVHEGYEVNELIEAVELDSNKIHLTPVATLFTRNIAMPFDRYLTESSSKNFSKTV